MTARRIPLALASLLVLTGLRALAQGEGYTYLSYVGPDVALVSDTDEDSSARANMPVTAGDRIETGRSSRAEAILADGTVVRFDARTQARFDRLARSWQSGEDRNLLTLQEGALAIETRRSADEEAATRVDTEDTTVVVTRRGLVRVDAGRRGTEVYVASGSARILARSGSELLQAGESAYVLGEEPIDVAESDLPRDRFTQFVEERRQTRRAESAQRLAEARSLDGEWAQEAAYDDAAWDYAASSLDDYGSWTYVSSYSRWCWRPRVAGDWRPFSLGSWRYTPVGLTWLSYEPWGWIPYHYGSWCWTLSHGWVWSPGWSYSPAWVYWSYTPSWVGWCPIGYYAGYDGWGGGGWYGGGYGGYGGGGHGGWTGHGGRLEPRYPFLRGRVEVTRIDPRGWSYVPGGRIGTRFDRTDVVRGDRVPFREGETGVISTAPLRIDRTPGVPVRTAVLEAVRTVRTEPIPGRGGTVDPGLTQILRREKELSPEARETLRRAAVPLRSDTAIRPLPPDQVATGRVDAAPVRGGGRDAVKTAPPAPAPGRGDVTRSDSWRSGRQETKVERGETRSPARTADGWRSSQNDERFRRGDAPAPRREGSERTTRETAPWRSPVAEGPRRAGAPSRVEPEPKRDEGWRAPAPRRFERSGETPRSPEPMRPSTVEPRREPPRSYDSPRSAPPQRSEPSRAAPAPRHEAPHSAPAPRYDPPPPPRNDPPPARFEPAPAPPPRAEPVEPRSERRG